jgi:hypothetical protein
MAGSVPWASVLNVDHTPASGEAAPAVAVLVLCVLPWPKSSLRPGGLTRFCQSGILAHGFLRLHCAMRSSSPSPVNGAGFAPPAGPGAWQKRPRTWSITSSPGCRLQIAGKELVAQEHLETTRQDRAQFMIGNHFMDLICFFPNQYPELNLTACPSTTNRSTKATNAF